MIDLQNIILPFTALSSLDYVRTAAETKVLETDRKYKDNALEKRHGQIFRATVYSFCSTSKIIYKSIFHDGAEQTFHSHRYVIGGSLNLLEISPPSTSTRPSSAAKKSAYCLLH
jgi:hypothetical protein